jgi:hypothetical protein
MTTYGDYVTIPGLLAGANLSASQYMPVKLASTAGEVVRATATTDVIIGVLQNDPADGEAAEVAVLGVCKAYTGTSNVAIGEFLSANSTGCIDAAAGNLNGTFIDACTAKGDIIRVLLSGMRHV